MIRQAGRLTCGRAEIHDAQARLHREGAICAQEMPPKLNQSRRHSAIVWVLRPYRTRNVATHRVISDICRRFISSETCALGRTTGFSAPLRLALRPSYGAPSTMVSSDESADTASPTAADDNNVLIQLIVVLLRRG